MEGLKKILSGPKNSDNDAQKNKINHLAINLADIIFLEKIYTEKGDFSDKVITDELFKRNDLIRSLIKQQIKTELKGMTIFLTYKKDSPVFINKIYTILADFFSSLENSALINENEIKVSIFGKWYDTPTSLIQEIKDVLNKTKEYNKFYLNFCINYDGQEEIIDACKVIALKSKLQKIDPTEIKSDDLKNNLYISNIPSPDRIININKRRKMQSFLLWESGTTRIHFVEKHWNEISAKDLEKFFK